MCMIVKIDNLSHDFRGITRIDNKVTFVSSSLPGEVVDIRVISSSKKFNEGRVISYIKKSDDRVKPLCPYYDVCGGCDTDFIRYDKAIEYKKNIVIDIMKRYANIDINPNIIYDNNIYGYRNKITMRVKDGRLALVEESSNNFVCVDSCLLCNDNINKIIGILNGVNLDSVNQVVIRGTDDVMVIIDGDISSDYIVNTLKDYVNTIVLNDKVIYGNEYITTSVNKYNYAVYPKSFFQVNTGMIEKLYDKVKEYAGSGDRLLDLYCGAGTIGIYLSDNFKYIDGIEVNSAAVCGANLNKKINNIMNINFECKRANQLSNNNYDVIVVDPPRAGLDSATIQNLLSSNAKRIVYVSCNPITLARDINLLKDKYDLKDITLFDMFPNTKHVESVILLKLI